MNEEDQVDVRSELDTSMLLPPTYFTVPTPRSSSHDPLWTRSALQEELERLRAEVIELRRHPHLPETGDASAAGGGSSISILNEVLMQQTNELNRLRVEAAKLTESHGQEVSNLQMEIESYRTQLMENEERFDKRLREVEIDNERQICEKNSEIHNLAKRNDEEQLSWREASEQKDLRIVELSRLNDKFKDQVRDAQLQLKCANEEVEKLRICESWAVDRSKVIRQNEELERKIDNLETTNDLKQKRLDTLQNILSIQEKELAKFGPEEKQDGVKALLCRWREKVFALMVQAESTRLTYDKDVQDCRLANTELERLLDHTKCIATTNELKVNACEAEVQDEKEKLKLSDRQLADTHRTLDSVIKQRDALFNSLSALRRTIESSVRGVAAQERVFSDSLASIVALDRRLQNAIDLLPGLKTQVKTLQAREAATRMRQEFERRLHILQQELTKVCADRDHLANNMEKYVEETGNRERNLREEYETEIKFLSRKCDSLLEETNNKSQRISTIEEDVADLQTYADTVQKENDDLKSKLSDLEQRRDEFIRITTTQLYEEHSQQMAQLQNTLDEVRREHTTTVIALRQSERDVERLQQEHSSDLAALSEQSDKRISEFQAKIGNLEAERNLLRSTLRQEGLLRSVTGPSLQSQGPDLHDEKSIDDHVAIIKKKPPDVFGPHLANLIEEVRSLVRSVEDSGEPDISDEEIDD